MYEITEEELQNSLYALYKEAWLYENVPAAERLDVFREYTAQQLAEHCYESFEDYLNDQGYNDSLYVCKDEFLGAEYLDREYIEGLLTECGINRDITKKIMESYDAYTAPEKEVER